MARVRNGGTSHVTSKLWRRASKFIKDLNLEGTHGEAWTAFMSNRALANWDKTRMAAGALRQGPLLESDLEHFDCRTLPQSVAPPFQYHFDGPWTVFSVNSATTSVKQDEDDKLIQRQGNGRFQTALQGCESANPQCGILLQGLRTMPDGCPVPSFVDLPLLMTPEYCPTTSRFTQVTITRAAYRDLHDNYVELSLLFACPAHAAIAWHMLPTWLPYLAISSPTAILTSDIDGDRHPLCKLCFVGKSWPGSPAIWEFQRPFGHPSLHAQAVTARILSKTLTPERTTNENGRTIRLEQTSLIREVSIRATYESPQHAALMINERVILFARGLGSYSSSYKSEPGEPYISFSPIKICAKCHCMGHEAQHCRRLANTGATAASSGCHTCHQVPGWSSCGRERCQLASAFDSNTKLMTDAAMQATQVIGYFSPGASSLRETFFSQFPPPPDVPQGSTSSAPDSSDPQGSSASASVSGPPRGSSASASVNSPPQGGSASASDSDDPLFSDIGNIDFSILDNIRFNTY